jgi:AraC-like DNA-binding protein
VTQTQDDFAAHAARGKQLVENGPGNVRDVQLVVDGAPLAARSRMITSEGLSFMLGENLASEDLVMHGDHEAPMIAIQTLLRGSSTLSIDGLDARIGAVGQLALYAAPTGRSRVSLRAGITNEGFRIRFSSAKIDELAARYAPIEVLATRAGARDSFLRWRLSSPEALRASIVEVMNSAHLGPLRAMFLEARALGWLATMLATPPPRPSDRLPRREVDRMHAARDVLLAHVSSPPTLSGLAAAVGTNEFALKRNFKLVFGQPPYAFLLAHRLEIARQLLADTDQSIKQIAESIGYLHASHFTTAFRGHFGVTPRRYRAAAHQVHPR